MAEDKLKVESTGKEEVDKATELLSMLMEKDNIKLSVKNSQGEVLGFLLGFGGSCCN